MLLQYTARMILTARAQPQRRTLASQSWRQGRSENVWAPGENECVGPYSSEKYINCSHASDKAINSPMHSSDKANIAPRLFTRRSP